MAATPYILPREKRESAVAVGNGTVGPFGPSTYKVFDTADVTVWAKATGETVYTDVTASCTIAKTNPAAAYDTFSVTFGAAVPASTSWYHQARRTAERSVAVTKAGVLVAAELEKELSKQASAQSELRRDVDRAVRVNVGADPITIVGGLAGQVPAFNAGGDLVPMTPDAATVASVGLPPGPGADTFLQRNGADTNWISRTAAQVLQSLIPGFAVLWASVLALATFAEAWVALRLNGSLSTRALIKALVPQAGLSALLTEARRSGQFVWTLGDFSAQIAADTVEGMFLKADSVAATVGAWVRQTDYLNPGMFGGVSDWTGVAGTSTDNVVALQRMIDIAKLTGLPMVISNGPGFYCNGTLSASNMDFILAANFGTGRIVFGTGATDGLVISQDNFEHATHITSPTLTTIGQETGAALKLTYGTVDSTNNRNQPRCRIIDPDIRGEVLTSHGWQDGIVLTDVHRPEIVRPSVTGRRDTGFTDFRSFNKMRYGIRVVGSVGAIPSDIRIMQARVDHAQEGVSASGEVEGLLVTEPVMVGVLAGVKVRYTSQRPWVRIEGGHINCFEFGVDMQNAPQAKILDMLIYKYQTATLATVGVKLDGCHYSKVRDLTLINNASTSAVVNGEWDGVQIVNSDSCTIDDITHDKPSRTVAISGTAANCETRNIRQNGAFTGATVAEYLDTSSNANRRIGDGRKIFSAGNNAITVTAAQTTVVTTPSLNVNKGERYLVTGMINTTKGGTAGDFLTILAKSGSATAAFGGNRSSWVERTAQAVSATVSHSVSAEVEVTASGTLTIALAGQASGSNSDVLAGDAQLTVEMI